jgi:type IV pilus assembly protein PilO
MGQLQAEMNAKTKQVKPLTNLPDRIELAKRQIGDFYKRRFPAQESEILTEFGKLAVADNVTIEGVKYKVKEEGPGRLRPVEMDAALAGNYESMAKFINAIERDDMFFIINSITLGSEQTGSVKLGVKLQAYLKEGE